MSDQLFKGIAPKSSAGNEYFFYCQDFCYPLYELIATEIDETLVPYPFLDAEAAERLGGLLQQFVEAGKAARFYCRDAKHYEMSRSEAKDHVEMMIAITKQFAHFLIESRGCEAVD